MSAGTLRIWRGLARRALPEYTTSELDSRIRRETTGKNLLIAVIAAAAAIMLSTLRGGNSTKPHAAAGKIIE